MKRMALAVMAAGLAFGAQAEDELPLKRVVLSTSGLAQFTHTGEAGAGAALELPVRLDQVDDLLKSLTIFDREGALGAVSLPGKSPLSELFRDLPFGPDALASQSALLNALVGRGDRDRWDCRGQGPRVPRGRRARGCSPTMADRRRGIG